MENRVPFIYHEDKRFVGLLKYRQKIIPNSVGYINSYFRISLCQILIDAILNAVDILHVTAAVSWSPAKINKNHIMLIKMLFAVFIVLNCKIMKRAAAV